MKRHFTYRIIALCMAMLSLTSGLSAAVSIHFCGDEAVAISLLGEAEGCEMAQLQQANFSCCDSGKSNSTPAISNLPCCNTEVQFHEIDGDPTQSAQDLVQIAAVDILFSIELSNALQVVAPIIADSPAPPLSYDRILVTQSFLC